MDGCNADFHLSNNATGGGDMSSQTDAWQEDEDWLLQRMPKATEDQIDYFCERVSIMVIDGHLDSDRARKLTLNRLENNLWGNG